MADVIESFADGTVIERDFTDQEKAQIKADKIANAEKLAKVAELQATHAAAKAAAQAKLAALGLTVEDLQALGL